MAKEVNRHFTNEDTQVIDNTLNDVQQYLSPKECKIKPQCTPHPLEWLK